MREVVIPNRVAEKQVDVDRVSNSSVLIIKDENSNIIGAVSWWHSGQIWHGYVNTSVMNKTLTITGKNLDIIVNKLAEHRYKLYLID